MRYCKSVIGILLLCCCLLLLWGCGADKAAITQEAEPWVIYQGIVIGQDDLDTVKAALGEPQKITEYKEFHTFRYNGFSVHFYNETCNGIELTGVDAPALKNKIQIGSSLADVLNKCPAVPEEIEVVQGILPDGLGKGLVEEAKRIWFPVIWMRITQCWRVKCCCYCYRVITLLILISVQLTI